MTMLNTTVNYYIGAYLMANSTLPFDFMAQQMMAWTTEKKLVLDREAQIWAKTTHEITLNLLIITSMASSSDPVV